VGCARCQEAVRSAWGLYALSRWSRGAFGGRRGPSRILIRCDYESEAERFREWIAEHVQREVRDLGTHLRVSVDWARLEPWGCRREFSEIIRRAALPVLEQRHRPRGRPTHAGRRFLAKLLGVTTQQLRELTVREPVRTPAPDRLLTEEVFAGRREQPREYNAR